jgi:RNA-directed DNA polymerase
MPLSFLPAELASEAALFNYLGMSAEELNKIWWFRGRMYHQFEIAKGKGKTRIINAPDERLKYLQRKIALLLDQLYRVRNPVHGFVAGKSVKTNALAHLRNRFVLNIDLKDFFPSITENRVTGVLESIGVDGRVANITARLCCHNARLPQGAPTSPVLSNMICFRLDRELLSFAKSARCIYTRYADDITLSSPQPMAALFEGSAQPSGHFAPDLLVPALHNIVAGNGFKINPTKTHYADRHSRRMVTGLKINELLNVDRRYVRNIRAALYSVETLGKKVAQKKFESDHGGKIDLSAHLRGKITWLW